jgi:hypothetical protein
MGKGINPSYPGPSQTLKLFASSILNGSGYLESIIYKNNEKFDFKTMN